MKKLFTIDSVAVAFFSAIGYGFGYAIPTKIGLGVIPSIVICFALGTLFDTLGNKILFDRAVQENPSRRYMVLAGMAIIFAAAYFAGKKFFEISLFNDVNSNLVFTVGLPVLGFVVSFVKKFFKLQKIRKKQGDGSLGFQIDYHDRKQMESLNDTNKEITGDYDHTVAVAAANGVFVPKKNKSVLAYLGIPFAKPPVGELRFKAPQEPEDSEKVFEAMNYGPSPLQVYSAVNILNDHIQSEDCLYLNIWTAAKKENSEPDGKGKPVFVYIPGADYNCVGSAHPIYSGEQFVKDHPDVVFVNFNFRLGLMGFLSVDDLPGMEQFPDRKNLGILDQLAALNWIRKNIAAFGGDPDNVTLISESCGVFLVLALSVCEKAKGLFRKCILLSGSYRSVTEDEEEISASTGKQFIKDFDVSCADDLLKIPESDLADYFQSNPWISCIPNRDGKLIPSDIEKAFADGKADGICFIFGTSKDEMNAIRSSDPANQKWLTEKLEHIFESEDGSAEAVKQIYTEAKKKYGEEKAVNLALEYWYAEEGTNILLDKLRSRGNTAYHFFFDLNAVIEKLGSGSLGMIATILGNKDAAEKYGTIVNEDVMLILQALIVKFLRDEEMELFNNEISGVNALQWEACPKTMNISENGFECK